MNIAHVLALAYHIALMDKLQLNLFGVPTLLRNAQVVSLSRAKALALLVYLAASEQARPREHILNLLWPESMAQAARKNLRNTLWEIREALGDNAIEQSGDTLRLAANAETDLQQVAHTKLESASLPALEAAAALYRGELAEGLVLREAPEYELWLDAERERFRALFLRLVEQIIIRHQRGTSWPAVEQWARRGLMIDPLSEPLHLALIEALIRQGQRTRASEQYAALTEGLQRELGVAPLPTTLNQYQALLVDAAQPVQSLRTIRPEHMPPSTPFIGREADLSALDTAWSWACQPASRIALIAGELGIGKTRLWQQWAERLAPEIALLATHVLETSDLLPFGPLLGLLRQPAVARELIGPGSQLAPIWLAELARLLPEIAVTHPNLPAPLTLGPAEERARILQALTEAIRPLAERGLVVVIDDLHWADPSTLDWLSYALDTLRTSSLLIIGTYRPQDAAPRLTAAAASWQRQRWLHHVSLHRLSFEECSALLTAWYQTPEPICFNRWIEQSGGNPYFLLELSRSKTDDSFADLSSLIRARLQATVPSEAMPVLQAAAVLGEDSSLALLGAVSGRDEDALLDALDALTGAAVLAEHNGTYQFAHPLVAALVNQDISSPRRAALHRRAGEALETQSEPLPVALLMRLVMHFTAANLPERVALYAEQAAHRALEFAAFEEATTYARQALGSQPTPERNLLLGATLAISGSFVEAQEYLEQAFQSLLANGDSVGATWASIELARMAIGTSRPALARAMLDRAPLAAVQAIDPMLMVQAQLMAASIERQSANYAVAAQLLDTVAELARRHGLVRAAGPLAFERGNLLSDQGQHNAARAMFIEALAQTAEDPLATSMAANNLAFQELHLGMFEYAENHVKLARELAERNALVFQMQYVNSTAGELAEARGDLSAAEVAFANAYQAARSWHNTVHMANVRGSQAQLALRQGDAERAKTLLHNAYTIFDNASDPMIRAKLAAITEALAAHSATQL